MNSAFQAHCPLPSTVDDCVQLAHGEGGRLMRKLLSENIAPILGAQIVEDAGRCSAIDGPIAVTTDSFVVSPLFFPGGDIGSLAVFGTVNDLAVAGAKPLWLTFSLILEEGLPLKTLDNILQSASRAARQCGVQIVAGDTKVVPRGAADQMFINTTGIGQLSKVNALDCRALCIGDILLVSGPIGQHGIAVLTAREQLELRPSPSSDCAPLVEPCAALHQALGRDLKAMRDATRGGLSAVLHEWSLASDKTLKLTESLIPVSAEVRGACELLGLDPLYVANEGTFVAAVAPNRVEDALEVLRAFAVSKRACVIGEVQSRGSAPVVIERLFGSLRPIDEPAGAPLPRIC